MATLVVVMLPVAASADPNPDSAAACEDQFEDHLGLNIKEVSIPGVRQIAEDDDISLGAAIQQRYPQSERLQGFTIPWACAPRHLP